MFCGDDHVASGASLPLRIRQTSLTSSRLKYCLVLIGRNAVRYEISNRPCLYLLSQSTGPRGTHSAADGGRSILLKDV